MDGEPEPPINGTFETHHGGLIAEMDSVVHVAIRSTGIGRTRVGGERRLTSWIQKVQQSGLDGYDGFIKTLRNYWNPILNYFVARVTSGFLEGLNNKIKTIKRRCYGIKKVATLFQRIWFDLEGCERFFLSTPRDPNGPPDNLRRVPPYAMIFCNSQRLIVNRCLWLAPKITSFARS